ncbi:MAG: DUF4124 domain-containing protein [Pseudomonadota bacterium]
MILPTLLLVATLSQADAIHRCVGDDGGVQFSDSPCGVAAESLDVTNDAAVRAWLEDLRPEETAPPSRPSPRVLRAMQEDAAAGRQSTTIPRSPVSRTATSNSGLPPRPAGDRGLASCSMIFFGCASDDAAGMDRCVASAPVCRSGSGRGCCDAAYVDRYDILRRAGVPRNSAVREALLGTN